MAPANPAPSKVDRLITYSLILLMLCIIGQGMMLIRATRQTVDLTAPDDGWKHFHEAQRYDSRHEHQHLMRLLRKLERTHCP